MSVIQVFIQSVAAKTINLDDVIDVHFNICPFFVQFEQR